MAFLMEIKDRLVSQGVGIYGTNIFTTSAAVIPTGSGPYLSLRDTGGTGSVKTQNDTSNQRPGASVLIRATTASSALQMATNAYNALGGAKGLYNITLTGVFYVNVTIRQEPMDIGKDEAGRIMYSFNIDAQKSPS
jgi:hypothetical protein